MKKILTIMIIAGSICWLSGIGQSVTAAELFWRLPASTVNLQHTFVADVMLDTEEQSINAIEGTIHLTGNSLKLEKIINANSVVALWVTPPTIPAQGHDIPFAGMIPTGYSGRQAIVFSLVLTGASGGSETLSVDAVKAYANDGQGTSVPVTVRTAIIDVNPLITESPSSILNFHDDTEQPEDFTPIVSRDRTLYNNAWFVVFSAQDKQSGVSRYEIQEVSGSASSPRSEAWIPATSPYQLHDQNLHSTIFIRAIDNAGNARVVSLPPSSLVPYSWLWIYSILIVIIAALIFIWWRKKRTI
jgi:hypothetical protein